MVLNAAGGFRMGDGGIIIFLVMTIFAGVALMMAAMNNRRKIREMEHRERLAMIERGVVPSPETNPAAFEAAAGFAPPSKDEVEHHQRYRTAGILLIGLGFGLMFIIGVAAGATEVGLGVGGAWVSLGAASLLNYWLMTRRAEEERRWSRPPVRRPEPPPNITS
jgi:hypothetical protein